MVAVERGMVAWDSVVAPDDDVAIAALTAAELLLGVQLADAFHRQTRHEFVEGILERVPCEDYSLETARSHAALLSYVRRSGTMRGAHDLIIAATAVASTRTVVTADAGAFEDLPGVVVRTIASHSA